jgi:hypothetical protein
MTFNALTIGKEQYLIAVNASSIVMKLESISNLHDWAGERAMEV